MNKHYFFVHISLFVILAFLAATLFYTRNAVSEYVRVKTPLADFLSLWNPSAYPSLTDPITSDLYGISSEGIVVMDNDTKVVLFGKNQNAVFSMASTTKLMTALVALEHYTTEDTVTIQRVDIEGVRVGFKKGEKLLFKDLLYAMLLPSGNDAAYAVAQNYPGGVEAFVEKMNAKAKELSLGATHFSDPTGLDDQGDYTTPMELARLASIALSNKTIAEVVSTKEKTITTFDNTRSYRLVNLNRLLGNNGVSGVKTGYTDGAGGILITAQKKNGHTILFVVMKSRDRFFDTRKILGKIDETVSYKNFIFTPSTD